MKSNHGMSSFHLVTRVSLSFLAGAGVTLMGRGLAPRAAAASPRRTVLQDAATGAQKEKPKVGRPVVHFEIGCRDSEKTSAFYSKLFDWTIKHQGAAGMIDTGNPKGINGHITSLGHEPEHYIAFYVEVADIKTYLDKAKALGGKAIVGPVEIPTAHFAWFSDPDGNVVGLLQPKAATAK